EIQKYNSEVITTYPGINNQTILDLEVKLKSRLPGDFKRFLTIINGFELMSDIIYGIHNDPKMGLYNNYVWELKESNNPIYHYLLPISPNGFGDHYCLDLNSLSEDATRCEVVFWQHDYEYSDGDTPDKESSSFTDYLEELIMDVGENYNYDGSDK
ncbi:MAG: SMI1/KNR4 family protein, partial [Calditrichota bacterium]